MDTRNLAIHSLENKNSHQSLRTWTKLEALQDKIKANELTTLDLSQVKVDDLKSEIREVKEWNRHSAAVYALALLPGGVLASGSSDNSIKLWNVETGECFQTLTGHSNAVQALTVLPEGELASGSGDGTIKLWNTKTGECLQTLSGHNYGTIKIWNTETGESQRILNANSFGIFALIALPGEMIASGSSDNTIKLWNVKTGECIQTLTGHNKVVSSLTVLPSGDLVSGAADGKIKRWNTKTGKCLQTLSEHSSDYSIFALRVLAGGELVSASQDSTIKLWDIQKGKCLRTLIGHNGYVTALTELPGEELVSGSWCGDQTIKLWNVKTGECIRTLSGHSNVVSALTILPSGELISASGDGAIKLWNTNALQRQLLWKEVSIILTDLKTNRSLTRLTIGLRFEGIKELENEIIESLIELLLVNNTLSYLDLQKTGISEQGVRRLYEAMKQHKPALVIEHEAMPEIQAEQAREELEDAARQNVSLSPSLRSDANEVKLVARDNTAAVVMNELALNTLLQQLKSLGLSVADLTRLQQSLSAFSTVEIQWVQDHLAKWKAMESRLATISESAESSVDAKAEQAEIDQCPALSAYQCRLQQELARFTTAYWLSTSSLFKLRDDKQEIILNVINGLPVIGSYLSIFMAGVQLSKDKYRSYRINQLADLFIDTNMIVQVYQSFARQMARANANEIKAQKVEECAGMKERVVGFYHDVKNTMQKAMKEWKTNSDISGVKLLPSEILARLHGAYLLDQILQSQAEIKKTSNPEALARQFLRVLNVTPAPMSVVSARPVDRITKLEKQQKTLKDEISRATAKLSNLETFNDLISEITAECKIKTNENVVDVLKLGFARLQARDEEARNFILERLSKQEEELALQKELIEFLLAKNSKEKSTTPFWQTTHRQQYASMGAGMGAANGAGPGPGTM